MHPLRIAAFQRFGLNTGNYLEVANTFYVLYRTISEWRNLSIHESSPVLGKRRQSETMPKFRFQQKRTSGLDCTFTIPRYSWGDAIILFCMIRELKPRRILEIGSGHTSCSNPRYE